MDPNFHYKFTLRSTIEAIDWFKRQVKSVIIGKSESVYDENTLETNLTPEQKKDELLNTKQYETTEQFEVGKMYLFHYDPKGRDKLPYYDTFPLILLTGIKNNTFSGLNLHYLPVESRMILLSNLTTQKSVFKDGNLDRLNIKYDNLKNVQEFQFFQPCFKQYCISNIKSSIKMIPSNDWGFAAALPIETFKKKSKQQVWVESLKTQDMTL
jgi:hypothetical protein